MLIAGLVLLTIACVGLSVVALTYRDVAMEAKAELDHAWDSVKYYVERIEKITKENVDLSSVIQGWKDFVAVNEKHNGANHTRTVELTADNKRLQAKLDKMVESHDDLCESLCDLLYNDTTTD